MNDLQEDEPLLISALNQYLFCPRRCALMHTEGIWADNAHTAQGTLLHEHADSAGYEVEKGVKLLRGLPLYSTRYGLAGRADIVEVRDGGYTPVEYKKGNKPKPKIRLAQDEARIETSTRKGSGGGWRNDDVQLCAQGLCLEEMFGAEVARGFIFHAASKRRREVVFDAALRGLTIETIAAVRALLQAGRVPAARLLPRCDGCSLRGVCMPELTDTSRAACATAARALWE